MLEISAGFLIHFDRVVAPPTKDDGVDSESGAVIDDLMPLSWPSSAIIGKNNQPSLIFINYMA